MTFLIYHLLAVIDTAVYFLASVMFRVIVDIAQSNFFTEGQIADFASRVYIVVGVLMLFKLVIAAVQYMINPDTFDDKEKGMGGILKKTVISVSLIAITPVIFNFLITIQESIISSLPSLILGSEAPKGDDYDHIGSELSFTVLSSFIDTTDAGKKQGASVGIKSGTIHDLDSFNRYITDGCPNFFTEILGGKGMSDCHYNYMIIVSTIAGGFLCYTLLTMILDVSIRLIKFGIIQLLAPIPISSYIFSKDKLNKFVKTATTVYLDLFIRLGIVYFIIFFIQKVVENGTFRFLGPGVADTGNFFRNAIVNIAVIFGLLMFAKSAPKFITELLGLPDVGSGDFADMFKPAWQRAGGAAGALINPLTTAGANFRQAYRENKRPFGESLRRAIGGFGRGALDSVQGVMAGDDWKKMRGRHDAAVKKSAENILRRVKRDTDRTVNQRKRSRLQDAITRLGSAIGLDTAYRVQAEQDYNNYMTSRNNRISALKQEINSGTLTHDQKNARLHELKQLQAEQASISTAEGKENWIKDATYYRNAEANQNARLNEINTKISDNRSRIQAINSQIAAGVSDDERAQLELEKESLLTESKNLAAESKTITDDKNADVQKRIAEFKRHNKEIEEKTKEYQKQIDIIDETINEPIHGRIWNEWDTYWGGPGSQGKTYISFAETLGKNRSSIYTGEAMDKMKKNADILVDEDGKPLEYKTAFSTRDDLKFSYEKITQIKTEFNAGKIDPADLETEYGLNAATLESAFQEIEKYAARDYINANILAADGDRVIVDKDGNEKKLIDEIRDTTGKVPRLKRGSPNTTVVEWWDRFESDILAAGLSREEAAKYHNEFLRNPGKFIAGGSDLKERLITRGTRIVDAEKPKDGK